MSNTAKPKKILVPIFNRAHYGRLRSVLRAIREHPGLELQLMVASGAADRHFWLNLKHSRPHSWRRSLPAYLRARVLSWAERFRPELALKDNFVAQAIRQDGFSIDSRVPLFFDGGLPETMAKSVGLGLIGLVDELKRLQPNIVFINADRFEMLAAAMGAAYLNIPIAHNEAGDVSGTIDESIRHAITKLAHMHFTSTETSRQRVIQMGENPDYVFNVGSPAIDVLQGLDVNPNAQLLPDFDTSRPYLLALVHPVATESPESNAALASNLAKVLEELDVPTVFLGSNIDAMSAEVGKTIRRLRAKKNLHTLHLTKNLPPDTFYKVLANAACTVGNSSSFIREGGYFGTPAVLIGTRQQNREHGPNVITVSSDPFAIQQAIAKQLEHGRYPSDARFGAGDAGTKIAVILATVEPTLQKRFHQSK